MLAELLLIVYIGLECARFFFFFLFFSVFIGVSLIDSVVLGLDALE